MVVLSQGFHYSKWIWIITMCRICLLRNIKKRVDSAVPQSLIIVCNLFLFFFFVAISKNYIHLFSTLHYTVYYEHREHYTSCSQLKKTEARKQIRKNNNNKVWSLQIDWIFFWWRIKRRKISLSNITHTAHQKYEMSIQRDYALKI